MPCHTQASCTRFAERRLLHGARRWEGRLRTIPDDTTARPGGKLPHAETSAIGQVKKIQQNRAAAFGTCQITGIFFNGPADCAGAAHGMSRVPSQRPDGPENLL
jgi:hypothetical protein